jgi:hypothetical protein
MVSIPRIYDLCAMSKDMSNKNNTRAEFEWTKAKQILETRGITAPQLRRYAADGLIRTSNILRPGQTRGTRLYNVRDLDRMIEMSIEVRGECPSETARENSHTAPEAMPENPCQPKEVTTGVPHDQPGTLMKDNDDCLDDSPDHEPVDTDVDFVFGDEDDARQLAAEKAVARACVRLIHGVPATDLRVKGNKVVCEGTGTPIMWFIPVHQEMVEYYWENRNRMPQAVLGEELDDWCRLDLTMAREFFEEARGAPYGGADWDESDYWLVNDIAGSIETARELLRPHHGFIQRVAKLLVRESRVSAALFRLWFDEELRSRRKREAQSSAA